MKGSCERNLYMLQVSGGCPGCHKVDESVYGSPKKVTFDDDGRGGHEGEIVRVSVNFHSLEDDFDHLIAQSMA